MADQFTLARPYAKAAFEYASEHKAVAEWHNALELLAQVAAHPDMRPLLGNNPKVTPAMLVKLFTTLGDKPLDKAQHNFVHLLALNRRLALLPEIAAGFAALRAQAEKRVTVELRTASEVPGALQARIKAALEQRLHATVDLQTVLDENVIGGALLRAGDLVIDNSVRGKLERLAANLMH